MEPEVNLMDQPAQPEQGQTLESFEGGMTHSMPSMKVEEPAPEPIAAQAEPEPSPGYNGLSGDELTTYIRSLEQKVISQTGTPQVNTQFQQQQQEAPSIQTVDGQEDPGDVFWNDPREAFRLAETRAKESAKRELRTEFQQERQKEAQQNEFWSNFYRSNPDLKGLEDHVGNVMNKSKGELANLSPEQGAKILAERSRAAAKRIADRINSVGGQALPQGAAVAMPASGTRTAPIEREEPTLSFVDQLNQLRKRRA